MPLTLCCIRILSGQDRIFVLSFAYNLLNHIPYSNPPRQNHGAEHQTRKHDHDLKSRLVAEVTMNGDAVKLRGREDIGTRRILSFFGTAGLSKLRSSSWSDLSAQVVHTHTHFDCHIPYGRACNAATPTSCGRQTVIMLGTWMLWCSGGA